MSRESCPHGRAEQCAATAVSTALLLISPRGMAHFPGCPQHKGDDPDLSEWGALEAPQAWQRLGNGEHVRATAGGRPSLVATSRPGFFTGVRGSLLDLRSGFLIMLSCSRAGSGSGCRAGAPVSTVRPGLFLVVGSPTGWSGRCWQGLDRLPGADQVLGPGPVGAEVEPSFALAPGQAGWQVEQPVAQQFRGRAA